MEKTTEYRDLNMTPREIVEELDRHIIGQKAAKRAADELKAAALEMISVEYIMTPINAMETLARLGAKQLEVKLNEHAAAINHIIANRGWGHYPASRYKAQLRNRR